MSVASQGLPSLTATAALVLADVWQWTPFVIIVMVAGLRSLPEYVYEAAAIDGLRPVETFFRVTLPLVRPVILIVLLLRFMDAFKLMGLVFMLTKGGPAGKTETLSYYIYVMGLQLFHVGLAAATSSRPAPAPAALCPVIVDYRDSRAMAWLGQHVGLPPDTTQCPASDSTTLNWTQPKPQVMRSTGG